VRLFSTDRRAPGTPSSPSLFHGVVGSNLLPTYIEKDHT